MAINTIEDAIAAEIPICVPKVLRAILTQRYPDAVQLWYDEVTNNLAVPGLMQGGKCEAGIVTKADFARIQSGQIAKDDCSDWVYADVPGACKRDSAGNPDETRDCSNV